MEPGGFGDAPASESGVLLDFSADAGTVLIAFGGMLGRHGGRFGIPPFEWFRLVAGIPVKRMLVRDLDQMWYQRGIRGLGETVDEAAARLRELVAGSGATRIVSVGNSAGGYGAILFGAMIGASEVHAFSPRTFLDVRSRLLHRDFRWKGRWARMLVRTASRDRYADVRAMLGRGSPPRLHVYVGEDDRIDRAHAARLSGLPGVALHRFEGHSHGSLISTMRADGSLKHVLERAIAND